MATSTSVHLQRIARLLPKNKDLWRLGQELRRWRQETGLSDARLVTLLVEKFPEVDVPSPQRIQMLRATSSLFPKSQRLNLSHSHHVYAGQHARAMVPPGTKKTEVRDVATKYLRAVRRGGWSVAQLRRAMATDAARGGKILHVDTGPDRGGTVADLDVLVDRGERYGTILADPPWRLDGDGVRRQHHYPTMSSAEIAGLPVPDLATDDAHLWLWATNPHLPEALEVIRSWGFTYRSTLTWVKNRMGLGWWLRSRSEHLLFATRTKDNRACPAEITTVLESPVREHSQKPDEVYGIVERLSPAPRIELFARQERPNWTSWGNEVAARKTKSGPSGPSGGHFRKRTKRFTVIQGDAAEVLKTLKTTVHCVVTSPPYFGLRSYGTSRKEIGRVAGDRLDPNALPAYLTRVCDVLDAVPLDPLGSMWVVIGDSRISKGGGALGVPERVALSMQERGWKIADRVAWVKAAVLLDGTTVGGSFTPTSNAHRLNDGTLEWVYRFTKCEPSEAYVDPLAVRIPRRNGEGEPYHPEMEAVTALDGRQIPNVWLVPVRGTMAQHYAAYPEALCERPIAMTCPAEVCTSCGSPRTRIIEWVPYDDGRTEKRRLGKYAQIPTDGEDPFRRDEGKVYVPRKPVHKGWQDCACRSPIYAPGIVLDPFCGSGTSGAVALRLGRRFVGVDLYKRFCEMTVERLGKTRTRRLAKPA